VLFGAERVLLVLLELLATPESFVAGLGANFRIAVFVARVRFARDVLLLNRGDGFARRFQRRARRQSHQYDEP